jgi:Nif-specific ferredoxin III
MSEYQALRRDGTPWEPMYLEAIDPKACIGCGRCFKVCGHGVLSSRGLTEDGDFCEPDDEEMERLVTVVADKGRCIGCQACARVCAKAAQVHVAVPVAVQ